jgi:alpha-L-fucosidase
MKTHFCSIILAAALSASTLSCFAQQQPESKTGLSAMVPDKGELDKRMRWFDNARFGMFIHWGVYSPLGCSWNGKRYNGYGEHIQRMARIPVEVYKKEVAGRFNPEEFDAEEWIRIAKETGMGYFIITSKHHDGFAMYDSKVSDYNIVKATPFGRDPMKELRDACRKAGIKFGFYYSHAFDWGEKDGVGNDWDYDNPGGDKLLGGRNWWETRKEFLPVARKYVDEKAIPQIRELIANYDPDIMWYDTPHKLPVEECIRIVKTTREASPGIIINGRAISGFDRYDYYNTSDCPYEFSNYGDIYWEGIPTTNNSYAYNENDNEYKPASFFIKLLVKAAARNGNILMNIGPMGNGKFSSPDKTILKGIADWWKVNGESSIRGTKATPLAVQSWGETTRKGNKLYLHVFDWPEDGKLCVGGLLTDVKRACLLSNPQKNLKCVRSGKDLWVDVPLNCPDTVNTVIVLECTSELKADPRRRISATQPVDYLRTFDARLEGNARYGGEEVEAQCVQNMTQKGDAVVWSVRLDKPMTYEVGIAYVAPAPKYKDELVEGDAGKEVRKASMGAAGVYSITLGGKKLTKKVSNGANVTETVGTVTLSAGEYDIRIEPESVTAVELFRPRYISLKPLKN